MSPFKILLLIILVATLGVVSKCSHAETITSVDGDDIVTLDDGQQLQNYGDEVNVGDDVEPTGDGDKYIDNTTGAELEEY